jgi:hypothetical protein
MDRMPPNSFELDLNDDDAQETTVVESDLWIDEKTARIDFDRETLSAEAKLVVGYLTMEEHGMFAELSVEEQQRIADTLKR